MENVSKEFTNFVLSFPLSGLCSHDVNEVMTYDIYEVIANPKKFTFCESSCVEPQICYVDPGP